MRKERYLLFFPILVHLKVLELQPVAGVQHDRLDQVEQEVEPAIAQHAQTAAIAVVRRGGTLSISGVYGGMADPLPMMDLFDKGIQIRMGQAHVKRWIDDLMPLVTDDADPLGVEDLATHVLPLDEASHGYEIFQQKQDKAIKVVLQP